MTREILFFVSWFCDVSARCINLWSLFVLHCSMYIEKLCAYFEFPVIIGEGKHTFPYRTRSLSLLPSMVVRPRCCARVDCCRVEFFLKKALRKTWGLCVFTPSFFCGLVFGVFLLRELFC